MKITMYELLGMIKDGKAPKKIKYENCEYYLYDNKSYLTTDKTRFFDRIYFSDLNIEVEILEEEKKKSTLNDIRESYGLPRIEEKKIPEKINEDIDYINFDIKLFLTTSSTKFNYKEKVVINKINEIIDYLKSKGE